MQFLVLTELDTREPDHRIEGPFNSIEEARDFLHAAPNPHELARLLCMVVETRDTTGFSARGKAYDR